MKMNQILTTGFTLLLSLQLIVIKSIESTSSHLKCGTKCSSVLYEDDWTGERLQFNLDNNNDNLDNQMSEIGINLSNNAADVKFTCGKRRQVTIKGSLKVISYPKDDVKLIDGKSIYLNDNQLWCYWTIYREDNSTFPLDLIEPAKLIVTSTEYQVVIKLNATLPIGQANVSLLSDDLIEQFKDYQLIGNTRYLLFTKIVDNQINFALAVNYEDEMKQLFPKIVTINLNDSPYGVNVKCDFISSMVTGQLIFAGKPFWDDLNDSYDYKLQDNQIINGTICKWSIPNQINYGSGNGYLKISSSSFDLSIVADKRFKFYSESNFKLTSSTTGLTSIIFKPLITLTLIVINKLINQ